MIRFALAVLVLASGCVTVQPCECPPPGVITIPAQPPYQWPMPQWQGFDGGTLYWDVTTNSVPCSGASDITPTGAGVSP